ncbi:MAG: MerR family transcriptional regulator [Bradyrhizobium sp.]|nr:MerR family transcriptional regulator [Bradyrhizobium sp.]
MRIGLLAARAGISTSRIRFYEAQGLLPPPPRRLSGYRDYDERALEIILFITRARGLGFSLAEVAAHLESPRDHTRKSRLLSTMEKKIRELDSLLADLRKRRATLLSLAAELRRIVARNK